MFTNRPPRLSVLLPCRNGGEDLESCIQSLQDQTFPDFEVVAIDDGSTDDTWSRLQSVQAEDGRFRVFRRAQRGIAATLIEASSLARADMLARMDADDRSHRLRFRQQMDFLESREDVAVVGSRVRLFPRAALTDGSERYEFWLNSLMSHEQMQRDLFVESPLAHPSVMIRRGVFEQLGGYRDLAWPEDYDLWLRLFAAGFRAHKLPETLLDWQEQPQRASRTDPVYSAERFLAVKLHHLHAMHLSRLAPASISIWGAGRVGKRWARALLAREHAIRCFIDLDDRKIGKKIHGVRVLSNEDLTILRGGLTLVAVGALSRLRGRDGRSPFYSAREEIREELVTQGFVEGRDFICVA